MHFLCSVLLNLENAIEIGCSVLFVSIIFCIETCSSLDIVIPKFLPREARSSNKKNRNLKIVKNNSRRTPGSVNAFNAVLSIRTDTTALVCWAIASDSWILYTKSYLPIFPI